MDAPVTWQHEVLGHVCPSKVPGIMVVATATKRHVFLQDKATNEVAEPTESKGHATERLNHRRRERVCLSVKLRLLQINRSRRYHLHRPVARRRRDEASGIDHL